MRYFKTASVVPAIFTGNMDNSKMSVCPVVPLPCFSVYLLCCGQSVIICKFNQRRVNVRDNVCVLKEIVNLCLSQYPQILCCEHKNTPFRGSRIIAYLELKHSI